MKEELRTILIDLSHTLALPDNPDLPIMVLFNLHSKYHQIKSALEITLEKGLTKEQGLKILDYALETNNQPLVQHLATEGIRYNLNDIEPKLTRSIEQNDLKTFTQLLNLISKDEPINAPLASSQFGSPLLLYALMFGHSEMAQLILDKGANTTVNDWMGSSALSCAISSNDVGCFNLVPIPSKDELYIENMYGFSPLHYAVRAYLRGNNSTILDKICERFDLDKKQIIQDFQNYPKHRINQEVLIDKLSRYILLQTANNKPLPGNTMENPTDLKQNMKNGLCHGLSFIFGLHATKTIEDLGEFYHTLELIVAWDGTEESLNLPMQTTYMQSPIYTLRELITQFCNDTFYFYAQDDLSPVDIAPHDRSTQYTFLNTGPREIQSVLDISMQEMHQEEFVDILKSTLLPNTIIDVTGAAHTISIACNSKGDTYYYDPNNIYPIVKRITDFEQLAKLIYNTMQVKYNFQSSAPHYLGVYHISDKKNDPVKNKQYPSQEEIVNKFIFNTDRKNHLYKELELCVLQDSAKQLACMLKNDKLPPISSQECAHLITIAIEKKSYQCLNTLIKLENLVPSQLKDLEQNTALKNYREIIDTLDKQYSPPTYKPNFF